MLCFCYYLMATFCFLSILIICLQLLLKRFYGNVIVYKNHLGSFHFLLFFSLMRFCLFFVSVNLSSDADDKLKIYRENFEKAYLGAAEEFYKQNAHEYLSANGVQNYMKYADQKLKEEEGRAMRYLETGYGCQSVSAVSDAVFDSHEKI